MLSNQEAFERAITGVLAQNAYSYHPATGCVYYDADTGNRCAIGHCLTEETAQAWQFEHKLGFMIFADEDLVAEAGLNPEELEFYDALQILHDSRSDEPFNREDFIARSRKFATDRNLNTDFLDALA